MNDCRCVFCKRYLLSFDFRGEFQIVIKCPGCLKTNVLNFARVVVTVTDCTVVEGRV